MRAWRPSLAVVVPVAGIAIALVVWWLHVAAADVPIRWSEDSLGQDCQFLSRGTERDLADAGRLPLIVLTLVIFAAATACAAALRRRVHRDAYNEVRGLLIAAGLLGAALSWTAYGATGLFAAFAAMAVGAVGILVLGITTFAPRGEGNERRALWTALVLEIVFIALLPLAVVFATGVSQSSVCMS